jgi:predicted phosphoribosyltransferase
MILPEPFQAVGLWYEQFAQNADEEVKRTLTGPGEVAIA